jgi:hypothetical protein
MEVMLKLMALVLLMLKTVTQLETVLELLKLSVEMQSVME